MKRLIVSGFFAFVAGAAAQSIDPCAGVPPGTVCQSTGAVVDVARRPVRKPEEPRWIDAAFVVFGGVMPGMPVVVKEVAEEPDGAGSRR